MKKHSGWVLFFVLSNVGFPGAYFAAWLLATTYSHRYSYWTLRVRWRVQLSQSRHSAKQLLINSQSQFINCVRWSRKINRLDLLNQIAIKLIYRIAVVIVFKSEQLKNCIAKMLLIMARVGANSYKTIYKFGIYDIIFYQGNDQVFIYCFVHQVSVSSK